VMALICVISWGIVPLFRLVIYLSSSPRLARTRLRAVWATTLFFAFVITLLSVTPFPDRFRAPGVLTSDQHTMVINEVPGIVKRVLVRSGSSVRTGMPLVELYDREIDAGIEIAVAQREETLALQLGALRGRAADLEPIRRRLIAIEVKLHDLVAQRAALTVRARQPGIWVSPQIEEMVGAYVKRGSVLGQIVDPSAFHFSAVVPQDRAAELFNNQIQKVEARIYGQADKELVVRSFQIIPFRQEKLPSAALGWHGGGEIAVSVQDRTGLQAAEPFFQINANIAEISDEVGLFHGRSGKLRFTLEPKPLLTQWSHKLKQLLQKRYQL